MFTPIIDLFAPSCLRYRSGNCDSLKGSSIRRSRRRQLKKKHKYFELLETRMLLSTISWDGGGDQTYWSNRLNWSGDTLPTIDDDVIIDVPSNPTIKITGGTKSVHSLFSQELISLDSVVLQVATTATINKDFQLLNNSTLKGGTWLGTGAIGIQANTSSNTLDGITLGVNLKIPSDGGVIMVQNDLILTNNLNLILPYGTLQFASSTPQTFGGSGQFSGTIYSGQYVGGTWVASLTVGPNIQINNGSYVGSGTLVNQGTIIVDGANKSIALSGSVNFTNQGVIQAINGGSISLSGNVTNTGSITLSKAATGSFNTNMSNLGTISVDTQSRANFKCTLDNQTNITVSGGSTLSIGIPEQAWSNKGTISVTDSTVNLDGVFTPDDVAGLVRSGGTVNLVGKLSILPVAPTQLASTTGESWIGLSWIPNAPLSTTTGATNDTAFKIERSPDGSTGWTQIGTAAPGISNYYNTGLTKGITYYYRVKAYNKAGDSTNYSNVISVTTGSLGAGLLGNYYGNISLTGSVVARHVDSFPGSSVGLYTPDPRLTNGEYSCIWTGQITPFTSETYSFALSTYTKARVWVNNQLVINYWDSAVPNPQIALIGGKKYNIRVDYATDANYMLSLLWSTPTIPQQQIPASQFNVPANSGTVLATANLAGPILNPVTPKPFTLNAATGDWIVAGGTIAGGTVNSADGARLWIMDKGGTLDHVTLNCDLYVANSVLTLKNDLVLNSTLTLGDSTLHPSIKLQGNQTIDGTGRINYYTSTVFAVNSNPAPTLTLGADLTISGYIANTNINLINNGTILVDTLNVDKVSFRNNGLIKISNGKAHYIGTNWVNTGTIQLSNNSSLNFSGNGNNSGNIIATSSTLNFTGTWSNSGTITANNGSPVNLGGTWSNFGAIINNNSAINLTGNLDLLPLAPTNLVQANQGVDWIALSWKASVTMGEVAYKVERSSDGKIWNQIGSVGIGITNYYDSGLAADTSYYYRVKAYSVLGESENYSKMLTGVTGAAGNGFLAAYYNSNDLSGPVAAAAIDPVMIFDSFNNTIVPQLTTKYYSVRWTSKIIPATTETYTFTNNGSGGCKVWVNGQVIYNNWDAEVANNQMALVAGTSYDLKVEFHGSDNYLYRQLYWSTPTLYAQAIPTSQTVLPVGAGAILAAANADGPSLVQVGNGTLNLNATTGSLNLASGTIRGGKVNASDGSSLNIVSSGTMDNVTANTDINLPGNTNLSLMDNFILNGKLMANTTTGIGGNAVIVFNGATSLNGTGQILLVKNSAGCLGTIGVQNTDTFTIGAGITIHGAGTIDVRNLYNQGLISADSKGQTLSLNVGTIYNQGQLRSEQGGILYAGNVVVNSGLMQLMGPTNLKMYTTFSNSGSLEITNGATVSVATAWDNSGSILVDSGSTLSFSGPWSNTGTILVQAGSTATLSGAGTNQNSLKVITGTLNLSGNWINTGNISTKTNSILNLGSSGNSWSNTGVISTKSTIVTLAGEFTWNDLGTFSRSGGTVNLTGILDLLPVAPTGITQSTQGEDWVYLKWTASVTPNVAYNIERSIDGLTGWTSIGTTGVGVTNFYDKYLTAGNSYYYRIKAYNALGDSRSYSNVYKANVGTLGTGLLATYFGTPDLTGLVVIGKVEISNGGSWGKTAPDPLLTVGNYSVRWVGQVRVFTDGTYSFQPALSGKAKVWVGGQLVYNNVDSSTVNNQLPMLVANKYDLRIDYYPPNANTDANFALNWTGGGSTNQTIPTSQLYVPTGVSARLKAENSTGETFIPIDKNTMVLDATTGDWNLVGGTIRGGTLVENDDAILNVQSGTFDGMTLNNDLYLGNAARLTIRNNLVLAQNAIVTLQPAATGAVTLSFATDMAQSLTGNGQVLMSNSTGASSSIGGGTLTIGNGIGIHGTGTISVTQLTNFGEIVADSNSQPLAITTTANLTNQYVLRADKGGVLTINGAWFNYASLVVGTGSTINLNGNGTNKNSIAISSGTLSMSGIWSNAGTINATNGSNLNLGGATNIWTNTGKISATDTVTTLGGNFTLVDIDQFSRTRGSVVLTGTLDLLPLAPTELSATPGIDWVGLSWIASVTPNVAYRIERSSDGSTGWVNVGTVSVGTTSYYDSGLTTGSTYYYRVSAYNTLGISAIASNIMKCTTVTSMHGLLAVYFAKSNLSGSVALGRMETDITGATPNPQLNPGNFSARWTGYLTALTSETYTFSPTVSMFAKVWVNGQLVFNNWDTTVANSQIALIAGQNYSLKVEYGSSSSPKLFLYWATPTITKQLIPAAQYLPPTDAGIILNTSIPSGPVLVPTENGILAINASTGSWTLAGGTIRGGQITEADGAKLLVQSGTLDAVVLNNDLTITSGNSLIIKDGLTLANQATLWLLGQDLLRTNPQLTFSGAAPQSLAGNGTIMLDGYTLNYTGQILGDNLKIESGVTIRGNGTITVTTLTNGGTISADTFGRALAITATNFSNQNMLRAGNSATLTLTGTWNNTGNIQVMDGAVMQLSGTGTNSGPITVNNATCSLLGTWSNSGNILGSSSGTLNIGDSGKFWTNTGLIETHDSTVNLGGVFSLNDLGVFNHTAGSVNFVGVLDLTPLAPTTMTSTAGDTWISLAWTPSVTPNAGYIVERSLNGITGWNSLGTAAVGATTYFDTGLTPGTSYYYRVKAYNILGESRNYSPVITRSVGTSGSGTVAVYYNSTDLSGTPVLGRIESGLASVSGTPDSRLTAGQYSARLLASLTPTTSEIYTFYVTFSGRVKMWVNNQLVFNNWDTIAANSQLSMVAGKKYDVRLEYGLTASSQYLSLQWSTPTLTKSTLPVAQQSLPLGAEKYLTNCNPAGPILTYQINDTLAFNTVESAWNLNKNGTIRGGTIYVNTGVLEDIWGTCDGVTLNGQFKLGGYIYDGITLVNNSMITVGPTGYVNFTGSGTQGIFGQGQIQLVRDNDSGAGYISAGTLTIGAGITIHGVGTVYATNVFNQGTIIGDVSDYSLTFSVTNIINQGMIQAQNSSLYIGGNLTQDPGSSLISTTNGTINILGNLLGSTTNFTNYTPAGTLNLKASNSSTNPELLEVMSKDLGNTTTAFNINFAYGTVILGNSTYVKLVDQSNNSSSAWSEALYINTLTIPATATLDLNGYHLYVKNFTNNGTLKNGVVNPLPDGNTMVMDNLINGSIAISGQLDQWSFTGYGTQVVSIFVNPGNTGDNQPSAPFLGSASVSLVTTKGIVLATSSNSTPNQPILLNNITLPADDTYRIYIRTTNSNSAAIGNYTLKVSNISLNIAPTVNAGPTETANTGQVFSSTGSFSSPIVNNIFTGTVDYGDGQGALPLILNANHSYALSNSYTLPGAYTIVVRISDQYDSVGISRRQVIVSTQNLEASVQVENGDSQRSMIRSVTYVFTTNVDHFDPGAFELQTNGNLANVQITTSNPSNDNKTFIVTFNGAGTEFGSLADGRYTLTLHANLVHDASSQTLTGGDSVLNFYRLFGDLDGDGYVSTTEMAAFRQSINTKLGDGGYLSYFDFDRDGIITISDYAQFVKRSGRHI